MLEEPGCVEVFLHPLLKVLEVTQENVSAVLETSHNITGTEIFNFDIEEYTIFKIEALVFKTFTARHYGFINYQRTLKNCPLENKQALQFQCC